MGDLLEGALLHAVAVAEQFADGKASAKERIIAHTAAISSAPAAGAAYWASSGNMVECVETVCDSAAEGLGWQAFNAARLAGEDRAVAWDDSQAAAAARQADLLRHIIGNPFRPPVASVWPATIAPLAAALYAGQDMAFALHDALLDAGLAELAAHFGTAAHPKGCWAIDLILGKQ
jgi:hypothetical protein